MTKQCQGAKKATVTIKTKAGEEKIVSTNPGIEIQAIAGGGREIIVGGIGVEPDWSPCYIELKVNDPSGTESDSYSVQKFNCTLASGCGAESPNPQHGAFDQARVFKNGKHFHTFVPIGWYSVSLLRVRTIKPTLTISDSSGQIYHKEYDTEGNSPPDYEVSCDDNCPEGQMRCLCHRPPGYCCISCEKLKSQVSAISSLLRK